MQETKWTKGPWGVGSPNLPWGKDDMEDGQIQNIGILANGYVIADIQTDTDASESEHRANAHLIAAAPAMYEELESLIRYMDMVVTGDYEPDEETTAKAKELLKAARGEGQ